MKRILFCCTHNRCRSRMAEALMRARRPGWEVVSAGSNPEGGVDPGAQAALREIGLEAVGPARNVFELPLERFDLIVTLCATEDLCPLLPAALRARVLHAPFDDPSRGVSQDETERRARYRRVRDAIDGFCARLVDRLERGRSIEGKFGPKA